MALKKTPTVAPGEVAEGQILDVADLPERFGDGSVALRALDALAVALAEHKHAWTPEEQELYDAAVHNEKELQRIVSDAVAAGPIVGVSEPPERAVLERIANFQWGHDGKASHPLARIITDLQRIAREGLKAS